MPSPFHGERLKALRTEAGPVEHDALEVRPAPGVVRVLVELHDVAVDPRDHRRDGGDDPRGVLAVHDEAGVVGVELRGGRRHPSILPCEMTDADRVTRGIRQRTPFMSDSTGFTQTSSSTPIAIEIPPSVAKYGTSFVGSYSVAS